MSKNEKIAKIFQWGFVVVWIVLAVISGVNAVRNPDNGFLFLVLMAVLSLHPFAFLSLIFAIDSEG